MARVTGTTDNDVLSGNEGEDVFVFAAGHGHDTISNFETGTDIIDLSRFSDEITWQDLSAGITTITDPDDPSTITGVVIDLSQWGGGTITLQGVTSPDDLTEAMFRMPAVNVMDGTEGFDLLEGTSGIDKMYGHGEGDILNGMAGNDVLYGGEGYDLLIGASGNDRLYGGEGRDTLDGGTGNDVLRGGLGNDTLDGACGEDTLVGGLGDDVLWGDRCAPDSADTFVFAAHHGDDTIKDFDDGMDQIDLSAFEDIDSVSDLSLKQDGDNVVIDLTRWDGGTITLENFNLADLDDSDFEFHDTSADGG